MDTPALTLACDRGTVLLTGTVENLDLTTLPGVKWDPRAEAHRAQGRYYRGIVEQLVRQKVPYTDTARGWENKPQGWTLHTERTPFPHQREAVAAWWKAGGRGVVVLPTGTGKSFVASLAIEKASRPTLIVVPTIVLMNQWYADLTALFQQDIGLLGGGYYDFKPLTVTTYDSAYIHLERWSHRFGLLVFDEAHHLPGSTFQEAAIGSLAPYRLGLTATPDRQDGGETLLPELIGDIIYRREIQELSGDYLANYRTEREYVDLTPEEEEQYRENREH